MRGNARPLTRLDPSGLATLSPVHGERDSPQIQLLEKVISLVVDHDEGGKILDLDPPDRLHAEFRIFQYLDLLDAMLGEVGGRATDRGEIETAVTLAGVAVSGYIVYGLIDFIIYCAWYDGAMTRQKDTQ